MMTSVKRKAFAYVTRGESLLVFEHPGIPEAGIQVPAGTIELDEIPENAVLREAQEESGLSGLFVQQFLGIHTRDMGDFGHDEIHERFFFHLICTQKTPLRWVHGEHHPSDRNEAFIPFEFYWVPLDKLPEMIADHDYYVVQLRDTMRGVNNS